MTTTETAPAQASEPTRNGVDTAALFATLDAVKGDPEIAKFRFRATNTWVSGTHNRSTIHGFHGAKQEITHRQPFTFIVNSTGSSNRRRSASVTDNATEHLPTSTATTTVDNVTGAASTDTTHLRTVSGGTARQRRIPEGPIRIPSDTSGGAWEGLPRSISTGKETRRVSRTQIGVDHV